MGRSTTRASKRRAPKIDPNKCGKCKELIEEKPVDNLKQSIEPLICVQLYRSIEGIVKVWDIKETNRGLFCTPTTTAPINKG